MDYFKRAAQAVRFLLDFFLLRNYYGEKERTKMAANLFDDICADAYAFDKIGPKICCVSPASSQSKFDLCPWIVNSILAAELSLKALLVHQGLTIREIHTHDLSKLFGKLNPSHRSEVKRSTEEFMPELKKNNEFYAMLDEHKDCFELERYPYEHRDIRGGSLAFISALKRACILRVQQLQGEKNN